MNDIDIIRNKIKNKKGIKKDNNIIKYYINKFLFIVLITIITLILLKGNNSFKEKFYKYVYENNISFAYLNNLYKKHFGSPVLKKETIKQTMNEVITYTDKNAYKDGVELSVSKNYVVPTIDSGMVIFIGEKEGYGNTVIVEQVDGTQVWYGNINTNLNMYDYIEKGDSIGEVSDKLYLVFKKDSNILNYEDYI